MESFRTKKHWTHALKVWFFYLCNLRYQISKLKSASGGIEREYAIDLAQILTTKDVVVIQKMAQ